MPGAGVDKKYWRCYIKLKHFIVAPLVEKFTFPANLTQGKRLRVICTVAEGDLPLEVIWKKNGVPILINPGVQGNNVQVRGDKKYTYLKNLINMKTILSLNLVFVQF